jgi:hypothetical protein
MLLLGPVPGTGRGRMQGLWLLWETWWGLVLGQGRALWLAVALFCASQRHADAESAGGSGVCTRAGAFLIVVRPSVGTRSAVVPMQGLLHGNKSARVEPLPVRATNPSSLWLCSRLYVEKGVSVGSCAVHLLRVPFGNRTACVSRNIAV